MHSINELRNAFTYDPITGLISRVAFCRRDHKGTRIGHSLKISFKGVQYIKARLAWALHYGYWPTNVVDHRDGNKQNNAIKNLRDATPQQNQFNRVPIGQYPKGVVFKKDANRSKPWAARIRINGKKVPLGSFATMEEAAECYRKAAEKYQGEFAFHKSMEAR